MRVVDCHVHLEKASRSSEILRHMDANGVDRILLMSRYERNSLDATLENLREVQRLVAEAPNRISGLAWLNPAIPGSETLVVRAVRDMGFSGVKIIPDHWFVYEDRFEPFFRALNDLSASVLFHTGILYTFEDGSRFCHPVFLEKLLHYPRIHFAMAHLSWPWCDECLAVMGRMQSAAEEGRFEWQSYIDTTPGTPPYIRTQAVRNALSFCGADRLLFGSDSVLPGDLAHQKEVLSSDIQLYRAAGLAEGEIQMILAGTADSLFPPHR
jgi:predicted TIM-barrel fold metal-dependent hydrolase